MDWTKYFVERGYYDPLKAGSIDGTDDKPHDHGIVRALKSDCRYTRSTRGIISWLYFFCGAVHTR